MSTEDTLGYTASGLCVISLIPEIYTAYTKQECNIGYLFLFIQFTATTLWIAYEVLIESVPLLIADTCILGELVFLIYIKSSRKDNRVHPLPLIESSSIH